MLLGGVPHLPNEINDLLLVALVDVPAGGDQRLGHGLLRLAEIHPRLLQVRELDLGVPGVGGHRADQRHLRGVHVAPDNVALQERVLNLRRHPVLAPRPPARLGLRRPGDVADHRADALQLLDEVVEPVHLLPRAEEAAGGLDVGVDEEHAGGQPHLVGVGGETLREPGGLDPGEHGHIRAVQGVVPAVLGRPLVEVRAVPEAGAGLHPPGVGLGHEAGELGDQGHIDVQPFWVVGHEPLPHVLNHLLAGEFVRHEGDVRAARVQGQEELLRHLHRAGFPDAGFRDQHDVEVGEELEVLLDAGPHPARHGGGHDGERAPPPEDFGRGHVPGGVDELVDEVEGGVSHGAASGRVLLRCALRWGRSRAPYTPSRPPQKGHRTRGRRIVGRSPRR